ncbi:MAG: glycoside hydrolase family 97 C-terminal domain-containing protein, partial [bacterium]
YPGKYVVLARRKGNRWYIAGINGENTTRKITLSVPFVSNSPEGFIITDTDDAKSFIKKDVNLSSSVNIIMQPYGGFVIKIL